MSPKFDHFLLYVATSFFWPLINVTHVHPISLGFMRFVNSDLWCRNWVRNLSFQGKGCSDCLGFPQSCLLRGAGFRGIFEWGVYLYGGEIRMDKNFSSFSWEDMKIKNKQPSPWERRDWRAADWWCSTELKIDVKSSPHLDIRHFVFCFCVLSSANICLCSNQNIKKKIFPPMTTIHTFSYPEHPGGGNVDVKVVDGSSPVGPSFDVPTTPSLSLIIWCT